MIRKREGFTLVELLVVVAIIIILAAILFPIFAKARDKAQQTRCLNNVKQMGTAIQMYEDDWSLLPFSILTTSEWVFGYFWPDLIDPYLKQLKKVGGRQYKAGEAGGQGEIYRCPSAPSEAATGGVTWQTGKNYGYNRYLQLTTSTAQIRYPSLTLRLTEVGSYDWNVHDPTVKDAGYKGGSFYAPVPSLQSAGLKLQAPGWHNGYNTVLWVDGHVSSITWERVMYTDNCKGTTTNIDTWCRLAPKEGYTAEG